MKLKGAWTFSSEQLTQGLLENFGVFSQFTSVKYKPYFYWTHVVLHSSLESLNIILIKAIQLNPNMIFLLLLKYITDQLKYEELQITGLSGI